MNDNYGKKANITVSFWATAAYKPKFDLGQYSVGYETLTDRFLYYLNITGGLNNVIIIHV